MGQLYSPFSRGKGTNTEKFNACLRPTLNVPEIIKSAVRFQESLRIIPVKADTERETGVATHGDKRLWFLLPNHNGVPLS